MVKKIIIAAIIGFIVFLMGLGIYEKSSGVLSSDGRSSALRELKYEVSILQDGSALVNEYRTYQFIKGDFSRGFLDIEASVDQVSVYEEGNAYSKIEAFDENRPEGTYAVQNEGSNTRIEWYYRVNQKETKTFQVTYWVLNTVTLYNDCADYFQKYLSSANAYKIKKFSVLVNLPEGANEDNTRIWAHGPVGGNIAFKNENQVEMTMENVPAYAYIEARFLLPDQGFSDVSNIMNENAYNRLEEMENTASEKNEDERRFKSIMNLGVLGFSMLMICLPVVSVIKYRARMKRLKPEMQPTYYRELPSDVFPAELDYLMNYYCGKENISLQISATLLDLICKGMIQAQNREKTGVFKGKTEILLIRTNDAKTTAVHEKALVKFLFDTVGEGGNSVTLTQVGKFCSNKKTSDQAYRFYTDFKQKTNKMVQGREYFETKKNVLPKSFNRYMVINIILMILPMIMMNKVDALSNVPIYYISISAFVAFMMTIVSGGKVKRLLTQKGEDQFALWKAFRSFLNDFTTFNEKELPELFMWEKYLVYATVLGAARQLLKQLYSKYPELINANPDARLFYLINQGNFQETYHTLNNIGDAIDSAMRDTVNIASKAASTGSGGGFSSGGSDSGGGSGGSSGGVD